MKIKISLILILIFSFFSFFIIFRQSNAQVCLPLKGNLVWSQWQSYRIPMTSSYKYVLTSSPLYVTSSNVGVNIPPLAYKLQVNGSIAASSFCLGNSCRSYWTEGSITGSGSPGQVVFWTSSSSISGNDNLFWNTTTKQLGINTKNPSTTLHVNGDITAETFSGNINAGYVIPGIFGQDTGNGNYFFTYKVAIGTTTIPATISATTSLYVLNDYIRSDQGFCINNNNTTSCLDFAPINYWALTGTITNTTLYPTNTNWNISIGTTTNSNYKLQVNGAFNIFNGGLVIDQTPQRGNWNSRVPLGNVITVVDTSGNVGRYPSITIGVDGLPIIAYNEAGNTNNGFIRALKVAKCKNIDCTNSSITIVTSSPNSDFGTYTSITIGSDGLPIIAFYATGTGLAIAKCNNLDCSFASTTIGDFGSKIGLHTSITIGTDGNPIIPYRDNSNSNNNYLKFLKCNDKNCSSSNYYTLDNIGQFGTEGEAKYISLALGTDGLPIIAYNKSDPSGNNLGLAILKCSKTDCSSTTTNSKTIIDPSSTYARQFASLTIGTDGLPIVVFRNDYNADLTVIKCNKPDCSNTSANIKSVINNIGQYPSITIGSDGLPIIAFYDGNAKDLIVIKCSKIDCSSTTTNSKITVDSSGTDDIGKYPSITIGSDGLPIIAYMQYYQGNNQNRLRVAKCGNDRCLPYWQRR
jgi:hypothetical protein